MLKTFKEFVNENNEVINIINKRGNVLLSGNPGESLSITFQNAVQNNLDDIENAEFEDDSFFDMIIKNEYISNMKFIDCTFNDCDFSGTSFDSVIFKDCKHNNCIYTNASIDGTQITKSSLGRSSNCIF